MVHVALVLLDGCYVVAMVLLGVTMFFPRHFYGFAKCYYGGCYCVARWLLWCCYGGF